MVTRVRFHGREATLNSCNSGSLATPKKPQYGSWDNPEATRHSRSLAQDQRSSPVTMEARARRETIQISALRTETWAKPPGRSMVAGAVQRPQEVPECPGDFRSVIPLFTTPVQMVSENAWGQGVEPIVKYTASKLNNTEERGPALDFSHPVQIYSVLSHALLARHHT